MYKHVHATSTPRVICSNRDSRKGKFLCKRLENLFKRLSNLDTVFYLITVVEAFRTNSVVNFGNNVFTDVDPQAHHQIGELTQNVSSPIAFARPRSTSKNLKQLWMSHISIFVRSAS